MNRCTKKKKEGGKQTRKRERNGKKK